MWRALRGARGGRGGRVALAATLAAAALLWRLTWPTHSRLVAEFPRVRPAALAHFLADFSNHPRLLPHLESWSVEEEAGNYTWWRYVVHYSCGSRCEGRAVVAAEEMSWGEGGGGGDGPRHGAAHAHRVLLQDTRCTRPPLLPWPRLCEEMEVETKVSARAGGDGARLEEEARGSCGALRALLGDCALPARRRAHLQRLQRALG